jgi:polyisoprenoid-binding protein YceI
MKNTMLRAAAIVSLGFLAALPLRAADALTRYNASSGSKMRIEGTSTAHDWQAVSPLILGSLEVGPNFPTDPGQAVTPGKVEVKGDATITVRSLQSVEKNGSKYSDKMDDKMYDMLKVSSFPKITFQIKELVLKQAPAAANGAYLFDSKGDLAVAGVTNNISMPVEVFVLPDKKIRVVGTVALKMSQFKIPPESILFVKTADDVTVKFEWNLRQSKPATATGASATK